MSARDEKNDNHASTDELLTNGVNRRNFLKYFAGAFAAAALPEVVEACDTTSSMPVGETIGELGSQVSFTSIPMTWVTRKQDGLSLGFQFVNIVADSSHNIALSPGAAPGSAYVAITFPPQHVVEDAIPQGAAFSYSKPVTARASGTSRLVFNVPTTYGTSTDAGGIGTFPYTLQGMLELCALSAPVVAPSMIVPVKPPTPVSSFIVEDTTYESLSQARIDRVISRVDSKAAARVRRRAARAARMLSPDTALPILNPIQTVPAATKPVAPTNGQTSIELPFRVLMSPDQLMLWSFMPAPVASPATTGLDAARTELWHARPGLANPVTGLADPSLGGLTLRALWTRDYDIYGYPLPTPSDGGAFPTNATYAGDPVENANPDAPNRDAIVQNTANTALPALNVNRLLLSPLGGTIDLSAQFNPSVSSSGLSSWVQNTVLGRDEFVECINVGTLLPFGHPAALVTIYKRAEDPTQGTVGVLYSQAYLVVSEPLIPYHGAPNPTDYVTFPFVALELGQTKIPCASPSTTNGIPAGGSGFVYDPTGSFRVTVGVTGTDYKGGPANFATPLYFCPNSLSAAAAASAWNNDASAGKQLFQMNRQRIALAPPADGSGAASTSYKTDGTSFETVSFNITLNPPSSGTASPANLVPKATNITLAVEALRHLQATPSGGTPNVDATFNYDPVLYAKSGFNQTSNPHEIFLTQASAGAVPALNFAPSSGTAANPTPNPAGSNSGGLVAPAFAANALSRAAGVMSGVTTAGSSLMKGNFDPNEFFGAGSQGSPGGFLSNVKLFGFIPLGGIIQTVENGVNGLASQYMPKSVTQAISNAEAFLQKAMALYNLLSTLVGSNASPPTPSAGQWTQLLQQVTQDLSSYSQLAQGIVPAGGVTATGLTVNAGAPLTNAQMQAAAWLESAATQAQDLIQGYIATLTTIFTDAEAVFNDITSLDFGSLITSDGTSGDLQKLITALLALISEVRSLTGALSDDAGAPPGPQSAAGAVLSYFGPVITAIEGAVNDVNGFLSGASSVLTQLMSDLSAISQGLDLAKNLSAEFTWKPLITGLECLGALAFIPSTSQALSLDIKVNANSNNGPTGLDLTCRLDSFAICFGQGIPGTTSGCGTMAPGYTSVIQNADVSLVFDHIQVQMLAGQKPDVDCVFSNLYFGGDLAFIETIKNLIPLDSFSDPPFVNVTTSGITAGFSLAIPNIAIGMFSIQNINIGASLTIPWIATSGVNGVTFEFDFCTIDNPFVVTVSMLGGGGFFGMTLDMTGLQRIQFGVEVAAQLAIDLVVASGSVSIEAGIFLVYTVPAAVVAGTIDPVSGEDEVPGWLIGGYLRLRGELDVAGIITISVELYLQITYSPSTGKCIASGFIAVDVSLFFFSLHAEVQFSRTFAGSNGDPTFAELMSPGGVDPMIDPTLLSAAPGAMWDPFAEYCMAYT